MRIRSIEVKSFIRVRQASVSLPTSGIVLICGGNGQGKSSLIESVPAAVYNKTLRGTPWWRANEESRTRVTLASGLTVERSRKGTKTNLAVEGVAHGEFDTVTKAQDFLDALVPAFVVWKKTCYFGSAAVEGSPFTAGNDGQRKRLLEAILAIDKFDQALEKCRAEIKLEEGTLEGHRRVAEIASTKREAEDRRAVELRERERALTPLDSVRDPIELGRRISGLLPDLDKLRLQERGVATKVLKKQSDLGIAERQLARIASGRCGECGRPYEGQEITRLQTRVAELQKALKAAKIRSQQVRDEYEELKEAFAYLDAERRMAEKQVEQNADLRAEKVKIEGLIRDAVLASTKHASAVSSARNAIAIAEKKLKTLGAVEVVLGLRGVRAHVLAHTLDGLSRVANHWLRQIGSEISVVLSPYTEKKTGGIADAISIGIEGAGGGFGYDACSNGERRRIDVALTLGLATLAQAADGHKGATLWFDEVFESIDAQGAEGIARTLDEISHDCCVVVVSHSKELFKVLNPVKHYVVDDGTLVEI